MEGSAFPNVLKVIAVVAVLGGSTLSFMIERQKAEHFTNTDEVPPPSAPRSSLCEPLRTQFPAPIWCFARAGSAPDTAGPETCAPTADACAQARDSLLMEPGHPELSSCASAAEAWYFAYEEHGVYVGEVASSQSSCDKSRDAHLSEGAAILPTACTKEPAEMVQACVTLRRQLELEPWALWVKTRGEPDRFFGRYRSPDACVVASRERERIAPGSDGAECRRACARVNDVGSCAEVRTDSSAEGAGAQLPPAF